MRCWWRPALVAHPGGVGTGLQYVILVQIDARVEEADLPADFPAALIVTFNSDERQARSFEILVDGKRVGEQTIERRTPEQDPRFFDVEYPITQAANGLVEVGAPLFTVDPDLQEADVAMAKASLINARRRSIRCHRPGCPARISARSAASRSGRQARKVERSCAGIATARSNKIPP